MAELGAACAVADCDLHKAMYLQYCAHVPNHSPPVRRRRARGGQHQSIMHVVHRTCLAAAARGPLLSASLLRLKWAKLSGLQLAHPGQDR